MKHELTKAKKNNTHFREKNAKTFQKQTKAEEGKLQGKYRTSVKLHKIMHHLNCKKSTNI